MMINNVKVSHPAKVKKVKIAVIKEEFDILIKGNAFSVINNLLHKLYVNLPNFDTNKIVVYTQLSYPIKDKLPIWNHFIAGVENELKKRKVDITTLFK